MNTLKARNWTAKHEEKYDYTQICNSEHEN